MAVGMKHGESLGRVVKQGTRSQRFFMVFFTLFLVALVACGELLALSALVRGEGGNVQAGWVWSAVSTLLFLIVMEFASPVNRELSKLGSGIFLGTIFVVWIGTIIAFGIFTQ
jgi:hypothetical protein